ncbi:MAG: hypothetical protein HY514_02125 [Candidatus Aenigmarchaeota archaeon]|nr:hypothetical protein [Candidatus Aenigmarchaeota archaeon]
MHKPLHALPLHHIDTSVLLEPHTTENGRWCKKYLQRIGSKYRGVVSAPVLSELMIVDALVSIDNTLIDNQAIKNEFGLRIAHPELFV